MGQQFKKWAKFTVRWGIAVAGLWWVIANMSIRDRVLVLDDRNRPVWAALAREAEEDSPSYTIYNPKTQAIETVGRERVVNEADRKQVRMWEGGIEREMALLAMRLSGDINRGPQVRGLLVAEGSEGPGRWIGVEEVVGGYQLRVPHPRVEVGLGSMVRGANPWLLWGAVLVFPVTFVVTSIRWYRLLKALEIEVPLWRAFVINMVGAFYNTFIPAGSTGGDLLKAYYAAKQTQHRTRAILSVVIDRVIGLLALIVMGGTMAGVFYAMSPSRNDPAARACLHVALGSVMILGSVMAGLFAFFHAGIRRVLGLDALLRKLPGQAHVQHAIEVMAIYRQRPKLILWAMIVTFPVHVTVVVSAILAGKAFGLPLSPAYYFVVCPVVVLVGAIPISPQGAGVMEFFAISLTARQGATVSQAFALTMSIRMVQIFWNLVGGIFVLHGGYRAGMGQENVAGERNDNEGKSGEMASSF